MDDLTRLVAIEDIRRLKARYWRYLDTNREALGKLFAEDAIFDARFDGFYAEGREDITKGVPDALRGVTSVHHGTQAEIDVQDQEHATGIWVMEDYLIYPPGASHAGNQSATASVHGFGHYVDQYVRTEGEWLFQRVELYRLRLEVESYSQTEIPDTLKA